MNTNEAQPRSRRRRDRSPWTRLLLFAVALALPGCVNSRLSDLGNSLRNRTLDDATGGDGIGTVLGDSFKIANVTVTAPSGAGNNAVPVTTIFFDLTQSTPADPENGQPIMNAHCSTPGAGGANAKPCACQFSWSETNTQGGANLPFTRTVETPVTNAQQALVTCQAPDVFNTEIADGTPVKITVLAAQNNPDTFAVSTFNFVKNNSQVTGSFKDALGRSFDNILHYSCYEEFKRGSFVQSRIGTSTASNGEAVKYPIANQFCIQNTNGSPPSPGCPNLPATIFNSAQAYYYNFFVRSGEAGDVNQWNDRYTCPTVREPIYNSGTAGTQNSLYPMDSSFALAVGRSNDFPIGVDAFVELANGGSDPVSANAKTCGGATPASNSSTNGFVQACLGFAAKPNPDGTCPYMRDANGQIRFTYRLRRFVSLYPPVYEVNGAAPRDKQATDTIYVLDRPVSPPNGSDVLKPFTMRGPKPCPFALFDNKTVLGVIDPLYEGGFRPVYGSTNNPGWNGTNVDGIEFPNVDNRNSCSAALPLVKNDPLNPDLAVISIGTVNELNPVLKRRFVRPGTSWAPHYEEDTDFQACAPQASPLRDPPLHFARDATTGNIAWCAESYPSQNDHVPALDRLTDPKVPLSATNPYLGHVAPFTSHVVKGSVSANCRATIPSTIPGRDSQGNNRYPAASTGACGGNNNPAGVARHPSDMVIDFKNVFGAGATPPAVVTPVCANQTCDRTTTSPGASWQLHPLLASPAFTELAISSDTTYGCTVTFDNGGAKSGKLTPSEGCCGQNVKMFTGVRPSQGLSRPELTNNSAHLEPDAACLVPKY